MMLSVYLDLNKRMKVLSPDSNRRILRIGSFLWSRFGTSHVGWHGGSFGTWSAN